MKPDKRIKRWTLLLGEEESQTSNARLSLEEKKIDSLLNTLYSFNKDSNLGPSDPQITKWVNDVRNAFPNPVFKLLQRDAISRFGITRLISNEEFLNTLIPDIHLVSTILSLKNALPEKSFPMVRKLISQLVRDLVKKLEPDTTDRVKSLRTPAQQTSNPKNKWLDWHQTIKKNLKNYHHEIQTIIPQRFYVHPPRGKVIHQIILLLDQSASMTHSVIYTGILGSILSKIRTIQTNLLLFDTEVIDMTQYLEDPVDLLMNIQLGGGTNIQQAVRHVNHCINTAMQVHVVLISDLYEGPPVRLLLQAVKEIRDKTTTFTVLLALDDKGIPVYNVETGKMLAALDIPVLACSPNYFPDLMVKIINRHDITQVEGFPSPQQPIVQTTT